MMPPPFLSSEAVDRLLRQQSISPAHPWSSNDEALIEGHLKAACAAVEREAQVASRVVWDHYGSGYASFVDAWFYRPTPAFAVRRPIRHGHEHTGLVVLLSRLSPYFVFMEGEQHWHAHGGGRYLPEAGMLDKFHTPAVADLAQEVQPVLERHGLVRAFREPLLEPLALGARRIPTILADRGFTQFDALFHWED